MMSKQERRSCTLDWFVAHPTVEVLSWRVSIAIGFDVRDVYVETYWLPILGPSAVLAARRLTAWLTADPDGVVIDLVELGESLGVGAGTGRHTQINRTLSRLIDFRLARITDDLLEIRTIWPPVPDGLRRRLPLTLLDALDDRDRRCTSSP